MWTIFVEKADCKLQILTNKYLINSYLQSHLISDSITDYIIMLNIIYLRTDLYPETSPGISVDFTGTDEKFVNMNFKHRSLEPFGCIFRPCV